jgi:uncharacterized protein
MPTASAHPLTSHVINTEAQLRALIGEPAELTCAKISDRLNAMTRLFIERSPFVCVATSNAQGHCDLSPRGDPAGFVRIVDDRTLLMPERPSARETGWRIPCATCWPIRTSVCSLSCPASPTRFA